MKRRLWTAALLFCMAAAAPVRAQQADGTTLIVHHADGTTTEVQLASRLKIWFSDGKVKVGNDTSLEFDEKDVARFTYTGQASGVSTPSAGGPAIIREGGRVTFSGLTTPSAVVVATLGGVRMPVSMQPTACGYVLSLEQLPAGAYVISVNGRTLKLVKQ